MRQLLRKLLQDLSASVGRQKAVLPETSLVTAKQYMKRTSHEDDGRLTEDYGEGEFAEVHPDFASQLNSPNRRVRTRLYFTSESHIQSLMNVLRYCHSQKIGSPGVSGDEGDVEGTGCIFCKDAEENMRTEPVFDYLTRIVFRLYEDKLADPNTPERYRVEVVYSPGAAGHPLACSCNHTMPLQNLSELHSPGRALTLEQLQQLVRPYAQSAFSREPSGQHIIGDIDVE